MTKVHRVVQYVQKEWVAPYIQHNTQLRQATNDSFKRDFYKLLNNAFFGKCLESVRKHKNIVLVTRDRQHNWQVSKPGYERFQIFSENLVGVEVTKPVVVLDKPIAAGFTILERSKNHMFQYHYDIFKPFLDAKLLMTDTDSFIYLVPISEKDLVAKLSEIKEHLDFSKYPENHILRSMDNASVLGKFKDEADGQRLLSFVGLRSKLYSLLFKEEEEEEEEDVNQINNSENSDSEEESEEIELVKKAVAGIKRSFTEPLTHEIFLNTLETQSNVFIEQNLIKSNNHRLVTHTERKLALCAYDDKRFLTDLINTRPYGHYLNSVE